MMKTTLSLVLLLTTSVGARAQPVSMPLTLEAAIALSLAADQRVEVFEARAAAADATLSLRAAGERPEITLFSRVVRTNHIEEFGVPQPDGAIEVIFPDIPSSYGARLDLQWPIYTAGRLDALANVAASEARAASADVAAARADVRLEVTRAYWALLTSRQSVEVVERATEQIARHVDDVTARLDVGLVAPSDVLSAEALLAREEALLIDARATLERSALTLRRLVGVDLDTPLDLLDPLKEPSKPSAPAEELVTAAFQRRHDRQAAEHRVAAARAARAAAAAASKPSVALSGGVDYARPNPRILPRRDRFDDSWDVGLSVTWPIWDGGRTRAAIAQAAASERARVAQLADFDRHLAMEVRHRRLDLESAVARIEAAESGIRSAAEAHRVVGERFAVGVATSAEVLDAQVSLLEAELDHTRALADARLAEARLARATATQ